MVEQSFVVAVGFTNIRIIVRRRGWIKEYVRTIASCGFASDCEDVFLNPMNFANYCEDVFANPMGFASDCENVSENPMGFASDCENVSENPL